MRFWILSSPLTELYLEHPKSQLVNWHRPAQPPWSLRGLEMCRTIGLPKDDWGKTDLPLSKFCLHQEFHVTRSLVIQGQDNSEKIYRSGGGGAGIPASNWLLSYCVIQGVRLLLSRSLVICCVELYKREYTQSSA